MNFSYYVKPEQQKFYQVMLKSNLYFFHITWFHDPVLTELYL
jgi:hypothetical protein